MMLSGRLMEYARQCVRDGVFGILQEAVFGEFAKEVAALEAHLEALEKIAIAAKRYYDHSHVYAGAVNLAQELDAALKDAALATDKPWQMLTKEQQKALKGELDCL